MDQLQTRSTRTSGDLAQFDKAEHFSNSVQGHTGDINGMSQLELEDKVQDDLKRATGEFTKDGDDANKLNLINRTKETLQNLCLELATMGGLKLVEQPQNYTLAPKSSKEIRANIKLLSLMIYTLISWTIYPPLPVLMWHSEICGPNSSGKTRLASTVWGVEYVQAGIKCLVGFKFQLSSFLGMNMCVEANFLADSLSKEGRCHAQTQHYTASTLLKAAQVAWTHDIGQLMVQRGHNLLTGT